MFLKRSGKLDIPDESAAQPAIHIVSELVSVVEAFAKCFHLIARTGETDHILLAIMFKIKYKPLRLVIKCNAHASIF